MRAASVMLPQTRWLMVLLRHSPCSATTINVADTDELAAAIAPSSSHDTVIIAPGTYLLSSQLEITRSVTIDAAQPGSVVLDAQAYFGSHRRVLYINGGALDVIEISGVNITGGLVAEVPSLH